MALINCSECGNQVSDKATSCPKCGAPIGQSDLTHATSYRPDVDHASATHLVKAAKSRGIYIILGLLFGLFGFHNFYAGRYGVGVAQFLITCILGWFVVGIVITFIWVIIDLFVVKVDGAGDTMA